MKFDSLEGVYRADLDNAEILYDKENDCWALKPGEFCWWQGLRNGAFKPKDESHPVLWYCPPGRARSPLSAPTTVHKEEQDKVGESGTYWHWDGNRENPTLSPSIGVYGEQKGTYYWHGFLQNGKWNACE